MFGFPKRGTVRHDPPQLSATAAIRSIDDQMAEVLRTPAGRRTDAQWLYLDRMLDARIFYQGIDAIDRMRGRRD
jgi:hypothetical protein